MSFQSIRKRSLLLLGSGFLAAALTVAPVVAGPGTAAWAAPQPTAGLEYVALGDSYAAGLGLGAVDGAVTGCGQTAVSYPRQLALALELDLTDVTCSGATTANILDTAQVTGNGTNAIQAEALSADTDIVTVTIGGNDLGFTSIIASCLAGGPGGPLLMDPLLLDCESNYTLGGADALAARVAGPVTAALTDTLATVNELAPNARVFVVGYPALMPDTANTPADGCFTLFSTPPSGFPFTHIDVAYLHGVQSQLDTAMATTAGAAGATFVPMLSNTLANTSCAANPNAAVNGTSFLPSAMHPNAMGAGLMTAAASDAVTAALAAPTITPASTNFDLPVGAPASLTFTASGFPEPTLALSGELPEGLSFDSATGVLSGTPVASGESAFSLTATNGVGSVTEQYTVAVNEAPAITSAAPPATGTVGTPYSFTLTATGFPAPTFAVTSGALPDGLALDATSGAITGTPTAAGSSEFAITASNGIDPAATAQYTVAVAPAEAVTPPAPPVTPTTPTTPTTPPAVTPVSVTKPALVATGSSSLLPLGMGAGLALVAGAGLLLARRTAKR